MKLAIVALMAAAALATNSFERHPPRFVSIFDDVFPQEQRIVEHRTFRENSEFQYVYDAQVMMGVPQSSKQHAATRIHCLVRLQLQDGSDRGPLTAVLQLRHIRMAELNRKVSSPRVLAPMEAFQPVSISEQLQRLLQLPVQFRYKNGMVEDIKFDQQDLPMSINIKKGVINMLQVKMNNGAVSRREERREVGHMLGEKILDGMDPKFDHFTDEEETIEGKCQTSYTFTRQPCSWCPNNEPVLNVTKSIDFEQCKYRPEINYNLRFSELCPSCDKKFAEWEKFLESSSVYNYKIIGTEGQNFAIEKVQAESQNVFVPYNEQSTLMVAYTNQTLQLAKSGPIGQRIERPSQPKEGNQYSSLCYSPISEGEVEQYRMEGGQQPRSVAAITGKKDLAEHLLNRLVERIENEGKEYVNPMAPRYLTRLVKTLRLLTKEQMETIFNAFETISEEQRNIKKDMFVDALGMCGSKNCLDCLLEKTAQNQINSIKAAIALKSFIQAPLVSKTMTDTLKRFCQSETCQNNGMLKQSCWLTFGSMVNTMCKPEYDQWAKELVQQMTSVQMDPSMETRCPLAMQTEYSDMLKAQFENLPASEPYEQVLMLKTISNAGLIQSLPYLEKIARNAITGKSYSTMIRAQAIEALRQLYSKAPKSIQRALMPIYMNKREIPELRMTAVYQLLQTQPERPILDQIARNLVNEPSKHVAGFVQTYLTSLANSTNPCEKRMADDLKLSLLHAKRLPSTVLPLFSRYYHVDAFNYKSRVGVGVDGGVIKSNMTYLPRDAAISLHGSIWGFWRRYMLTLGVAQQNLDSLVFELMHASDMSQVNVVEIMTRMERTLGTSAPAQALQNLVRNMGLTERSHPTSDAMMLFYLRFWNQEYAMLPLDQRTLRSLVTGMGQLNVPFIKQLLQQTYRFSYQTGAMVREMKKSVPTPIGLPLELNVMIPTVMAIKQGEFKPQIESTSDMMVGLKMKPSVATSLFVNLECVSPVVNSGVRVMANGQISMPIDMQAEMKTQPKIDIKARVNLPTGNYKRTILSAQSAPMTFTRDTYASIVMREWIEPKAKTIYGEEWNRVSNFDKQIGAQALGMNIRTSGYVHSAPISTMPGAPLPLLSGPNRLEIDISPGMDQPTSYDMELTGDFFKQLTSALPTQELKSFYQGAHNDFFESEYASTSTSSERIQPMSGESIEQPTPFSAYLNSYEPAQGLGHEMKLLVKARGCSSPRQMQCTVDYHCSADKKHCKTKIAVERTPIPQIENENVKAEVMAESLYPEMPYSMEQLNDEKKVILKLKALYGPISNMKNIVNIKMQGERSKEQKELLKKTLYHHFYKQKDMRKTYKSEFSPIAQYDEIVKASTMTQFKILAQYNKEELKQWCPTCLRAVDKAYGWAKYANYWNLESDPVVNNPQNVIKAIVKLDPKSYQLVNVTANTPTEYIKFKDVPLKTPVYPMNIRKQQWSLYSEESITPKCTVGSRHVSTFDGASYKAPISSCYSIVSKDCSSRSQPRYAVLLKKVDPMKEQKKVKIISMHDTIKIQPKCPDCQELKVEINGQEETVQQTLKREQCTIQKVGPYYKVKLPETGVRVYFDGYTVSVKVPSYYQSRQCGLCGHYDSDPSNDLRPAGSQGWNSRSAFFSSYLVQGEGQCQPTESESRLLNDETQFLDTQLDWQQNPFRPNKQRYGLRPQSAEMAEMTSVAGMQPLSFDDSLESPFESEGETKKSKPYKMTKIVESLDATCFSLQPVSVCPENKVPKDVVQTQQPISYKCVPRHHSIDRRLRRHIRRHGVVPAEQLEAIPSVQYAPPPRKETVPISCVSITNNQLW